MNRAPLASRLKRRVHREVAYAQDVLVAEAYEAFPSCVLHGGTAVWRCYGGPRFSEDVDAYLPGYSEGAASRFRSSLKAKGVQELKFKRTGTTVFGSFELGGAAVSFDGALREPPAKVIYPYETLDGRSMLVAALPPEELLVEKAKAYSSRRKVRDLFDVFFLLDKVEGTRKVAKSLGALEKGYRKPVDEAQLKALILWGVVPTSDEMMAGIGRWARKYT